MFRLIVTIFLGFSLLAACGGPSSYFRGIAPVRVEKGGAAWNVRQRGRLAEAVRINPQYAPRLGQLAIPAQQAIEQATGCRVTRLRGDAAMVVARLDCPG